jgi:hypothetical protein
MSKRPEITNEYGQRLREVRKVEPQIPEESPRRLAVTYENVTNSFVIVPGSIYFHNIVSFVVAPLFIYLVLSFAEITESSLTEMDLLEI